MALKAAASVIPAEGSYQYTVVQVGPKMAGLGDGAEQKTREGVPLWTVEALRTGPEGADLVSVTVAAPKPPEVTGPASFQGLRAGLWLGDKPRQGGIFWQADGVSAARGRVE